MKRASFWTTVGILLGAGALLLLNLVERDYYPQGLPEPPNGPTTDDFLLRRCVPEEFTHPCTGCGDCRHAVEAIENRRVLRLHDHDGWYRLFWAEDEDYYFEDPIPFAACLGNRTAQGPYGTWTLWVRPVAASCGKAAEPADQVAEIILRYELFTSADPIEERPWTGPSPVPILDVIPWFVYRYDLPPQPPMLSYGWRLAEPPVITMGKCPPTSR